jgi:HD-GYP domain-containing protein (c-di-GMP phosphodiesterase class II)
MPSSTAYSVDATPTLDARLRILSQSMGMAFSPFNPASTTRLLEDPVEWQLVKEVVDAWLASPSLTPRHAVIPLDSHRSLVLVGFRRTGSGSVVAFAHSNTTDHRLLDRLADTSIRLLAAECELDLRQNELRSCLEQLSYDLEEQSWLRGLSQHMQLSNVRQGMAAVATEILPSLRQLVAAESGMVLLYRRVKGDRDLRREISVTRDGSNSIPEHVFPSWLKKLEFAAQGNLRVASGAAVEQEIAQFGVRSYAAARLGVAKDRAGWLVAINKSDIGFASWRGSTALPHGLCSQEFGSVEAGLLESAAAMLSMHEHNVSLLRGQEELTVGVIRSMSSAIDARDPYTRGHSERVGRFARLIATVLQLEAKEQNRIYLSGLLHDVGKIGIPDHVLLKPGKLTDEEFAIIKQHPEIGARIVESLPQLRDLLPGILHHHESVDGAGYPHGLKGSEIPLQARIMAVADTYDAMTSHRPYRPGMPHDKAIEIISARAGIQWDTDAVKAFLSIPRITLEREAASDSTSDLNFGGRVELMALETTATADDLDTPVLGVLS